MAYGFVGLAPPAFSATAFAIISLIIIGLKELAVDMADPFGYDVIDFQLEKFLASYYANALACLNESRGISGATLHGGVQPPQPRAHLVHQTSLCEASEEGQPSSPAPRSSAQSPPKASFA